MKPVAVVVMSETGQLQTHQLKEKSMYSFHIHLIKLKELHVLREFL